MTTQKVKIGNIRGPKGDVGPQNKIIATKYEYQVGDSETAQPTGAWTSTRPETPQGKYCWTKVTHEFQSGEPAVEYYPVYKAKDGELVGDERLEELEAEVAGINDYTTGINLIKGSRDFVRGTKDQFLVFYTDGFYFENGLELSKDSEGFTVAKKGASNAWQRLLTSRVYGISQNETYTISFDYLFDSKVPEANALIGSAGAYDQDSLGMTENRIQGGDITLNSIKNPEAKAGIWYRGSYTFTTNNSIRYTEQAFLSALFVVYNQTTGVSVQFKRIKIERNAIRKTIWSASSFDFASIQIDNLINSPFAMFQRRGTLTANTDWNTVVDSGMYLVDRTNRPDQMNFPPGSDPFGSLLVFNSATNSDSGYCVQMFFSTYNNPAFCWRSGATVSSQITSQWKSVTGTLLNS